jgi:methylmalonyl-CoA/ethylmalonyl-CoA epimerase
MEIGSGPVCRVSIRSPYAFHARGVAQLWARASTSPSSPGSVRADINTMATPTPSVTFDHLAYLVRDTTRSVNALKPFFPAVTLLKRAHEQQGAYITYMSTADGNMTIELVEPFENNKLLSGRLDQAKQDCLPYHICLAVDDFDAHYQCMRQDGWLAITRPFEGIGFAAKAAHLYKPAAGIVEIMAATGRQPAPPPQPREGTEAIEVRARPMPRL